MSFRIKEFRLPTARYLPYQNLYTKLLLLEQPWIWSARTFETPNYWYHNENIDKDCKAPKHVPSPKEIEIREFMITEKLTAKHWNGKQKKSVKDTQISSRKV